MIWIPFVVVVALLIIALALMAANSRSRSVSITGDKLPPFNDSKPGVHSRAQQLDAYIAPLDYCPKDIVKEVAIKMEWQLKYESDRLIHYEAKTSLFGFVDDICFEFDQISGQIYVASTSRIGKSDMGTNRKRIEKFRALLEAAVANERPQTRSGTELGLDQAPS